MALARLNPHGLEVLTEDSSIMLALNQIAYRMQASSELHSLKPMLHNSSEEEAVSKPLLVLGELLLLSSHLEENVPLGNGSCLELVRSKLISSLKLGFLDFLVIHV